MAKNEAKITFVAETGKFNDSIKGANAELRLSKAEMKLLEKQMQSSGGELEQYEQKQGLLEKQLDASKRKVDALNQKLQVAIKCYGEDSVAVARLRTDIARARTEEEGIQQAIDKCNDELKEAKAASKNASSAYDELTKKISDQESELTRLKKEYSDYVVSGNEASDGARELESSIRQLSDELKGNKRVLSDAADKADELDGSLSDAGTGADSANGGFTILKGTIANLAADAIKSAISKLGEFASYLKELPEATREFRQDISTLETSFDNASFSADTAKETWKELYAIFGEDDRAVETANHISKMAKNQKELNEWVNITTGIWGTYQDSLPVEGLAEASNETAKTGQVTGVLADALNWSGESAQMLSKYMSEDCTTAEDAFNQALKECSNEQERQQLITETLTALYGDAANTYRETSGAQMDAKRAAAEHQEVEAELAETVEPVTTELTELKTELMEGVKPAVESVSGAILNVIGWAREHPIIIGAVTGAVGALAVALGVVAIAAAVYTAAQWAMNSAILANPITWIVVAIVAGAGLIVGAGIAIYNNWDKIKKKANDLKNSVVGAFTKIKDGIVEKINTAKDKVTGAIDKIKNAFKFKWSLPKISIPKFSVSGGKAPWGFGGKGSLPKIDVKWNKDGFIVNKASIIGQLGGKLMGAGEDGPEALTPISLLQDFIDRAFEKNIVHYATEGGGSDIYNFYVDDATINDNAQMREVAKKFVEEMVRLGGMNR